MAIKAGLVGVNPKGVDKNGMPISSKGAVSETQLTANGKQFHFAYDSTSEKYGYKLDGTGEFIPFESAGGGLGWVKPADLITTGLTYSRCSYVSGGYAIVDSMVYVDIVIQRTSTSSANINGLPKCKNVGAYVIGAREMTSDMYDVYEGNTSYSTGISNDNTIISFGSGSADGMYHIWGQYLLATT